LVTHLWTNPEATAIFEMAGTLPSIVLATSALSSSSFSWQILEI
jgi:hypothetical protein